MYSTFSCEKSSRNAFDGNSTIANSPTYLSKRQDWSLDQLGNWGTFKQDTTGNHVWDVNQTRTHNEANELETITSWANPAYDKAGNMTTMPQPKAPTATFSATYDAWNRLVGLSGFPLGTSSYEYDGLNRRVIRTEGSTTTHFYYNSKWQVLEEHKGGSGAVHKKYVYHPHYVDAVAVQYMGTGSSTKHFYLHDALFNVTAIMEDDGDVVQRYSYTPYGEATVLKPDFSLETGTSFDNEYLYTGRRVDPESDLQLNRNRYYHQTLGRWVNRDPIGYEDGLALFCYVGNNPINGNDPTGLKIFQTQGRKDNNNSPHKDICADDWEWCEEKNEYKWIGYRCYTFNLIFNSLPKLYGHDWLGWKMKSPLGIQSQGMINRTSKEPGPPIVEKKTTPEQDLKWIRYMETRVGTKGAYNILTLNCRTYVRQEWADVEAVISGNKK